MRIACTPLVNKSLAGLNPLDFGEEVCEPLHFFGPTIRRYFLIHFVISGFGTFTNERGSFKVREGQAFLIRPGEITRYAADEKTPWHYLWIGFDGEAAGRFATLADVFSAPRAVFDEMRTANVCNGTAEEFLAGKLWELYALLFADEKAADNYLLKISNYVETHYAEACTVADIAASLGLERHYLARLYRAQTGKTLKSVITDRRMSEAKKLLGAGASVADAAAMTGYADPFLFSRTFKKVYGVPPRHMKKG